MSSDWAGRLDEEETVVEVGSYLSPKVGSPPRGYVLMEGLGADFVTATLTRLVRECDGWSGMGWFCIKVPCISINHLGEVITACNR